MAPRNKDVRDARKAHNRATIRKRRHELGLSLQDVIDRMGAANITNLSGWELGKHLPRPDLAQRLQGVLGVEVKASVMYDSEHPIAKARHRAGWSQQQLAEHIGVRQSSVAGWEGHRAVLPSPGTAAKIEQALGMPPGSVECADREWETQSAGNAIYDARTAKGLTRRELADAIGAHPSNISEWERNKSIISTMSIAGALEKVLGLEPGTVQCRQQYSHKAPKGYYRITPPGGSRMYEHIFIYLNYMGWDKLPPGASIHHKNGVRHDNRFENLELKVSHHEHTRGQEVRDIAEWLAHNYSEVITDYYESRGWLFKAAPIEHSYTIEFPFPSLQADLAKLFASRPGVSTASPMTKEVP